MAVPVRTWQLHAIRAGTVAEPPSAQATAWGQTTGDGRKRQGDRGLGRPRAVALVTPRAPVRLCPDRARRTHEERALRPDRDRRRLRSPRRRQQGGEGAWRKGCP